jgi:hypothetical protein
MRPLHKYAEYFPQLEGDEFDMLVKDIKENGQNEPVVIFNGEILDGINRTRACEVLGIDPDEKEYTGDDPLKYVISSNIRRRHLDTSQRAMLATDMLPEFEKEAEKRSLANLKNVGDKYNRDDDEIERPHRDQSYHYQSREDAAKMFGVSGPTVQRAKRIKEEAPDKVDDIIKGKTTVSAVDAELREKKAAERAANKNEKAIDKEVEENTRFVREYFASIKAFGKVVERALVGARNGKFDPDSKNFVMTKHDDIRDLMDKLEELI